MGVSKTILGMNARNFLYVRKLNSGTAKAVADDKIETKKILSEHGVPTSELLGICRHRKEVLEFDWDSLPSDGFVVKPARGYGGEGIVVFGTWEGDRGVTVGGEEYTKRELTSHLFDILDGAYSLQHEPDVVYMEERVRAAPLIEGFSSTGLPDVRVIVLNSVPIMAMLRLPTNESDGKANLHMGAIGFGISIRAGTTFNAIYKRRPITVIPGTNILTSGIKLPFWNEILLASVRAQELSQLGYAGVDIVIDEKKGPIVLEVNARPGLDIQLANKASLRTRLERVEDLSVESPERGVEIGKALFAESSIRDEEIPSTQEKIILPIIENVTFKVGDLTLTILAKLDTGARSTSLDQKLAKELGLTILPEKQRVRAASGEQMRKMVNVEFTLGGRKIKAVANIADRSHMTYRMIVGKTELRGFLIDPALPGKGAPDSDEDRS